MNHDRDMVEAIKRVRAIAADEAERLLREASSVLRRSPSAFATLEKAIRESVQGIGASILADAVALGGNGYEGTSIGCVCGARQKYMNDRERSVISLLGKFRFRRAYYWCAKCSESSAPLDDAMSIAHTQFSPAVRNAVSLMGAEVAFGRGAMLMEELTGIRISKRKHREISEATGARLGGPKIPPRRKRKGDRAVEDLYISTDGTMAPTLDAWREVKIGAIFEVRPDAHNRPERLRTHYLGDVMKAEDFGWELYRAADRMGLGQAKRTIVLGDGAAWIWNIADFHFPDAVQIVDWYHATERLWIVANAHFTEGSDEARDWVSRCEKLLAASRVETLIERLERLRKQNARKKQVRKIIDEAIVYYRNNIERMRYRRYVRRGLFIGSGVIEAGCKHIVGQRLKQSGMRWALEGLTSILHLRLAVLNRQWPQQNRAAA